MIELSDCLLFGGLILLGVGLWLVYPWLSLCVVGGLAFFLGVAMEFIGPRENGGK